MTQAAAGCPYLDVFSADDDTVLHTKGAKRSAWSVWFVFGKRRSVTATMGNFDIDFYKTLFNVSHPCIDIHWFISTIVRGPRQKDMSRNLQIFCTLTRFATLVNLGHSTKPFLQWSGHIPFLDDHTCSVASSAGKPASSVLFPIAAPESCKYSNPTYALIEEREVES